MNCHAARPLLPLFADGELDARQMRGVALHSTQCVACEEELRRVERVQDLVAAHINTLAEEIDLSQVWAGVAPRIAAAQPPWTLRLREWWESIDPAWLIKFPAVGALALAAGVTLVFWRWDAKQEAPPVAVAAIDNSAILHSITSDVAPVALLNEPETNTMLLWVADEGPAEEVSTADLVEEIR